MPFNPRYTITNTTLNNLIQIAVAREVIEQSHIIPKWEASLRKQAKHRNTHASTAIEGNRLTLAQVTALADGQDVAAPAKDKREVLNYLKTLDSLAIFSPATKIKTADLLAIHGMVSKDVLPDNRPGGVFRDRQVFVGRRVFDGTGFKEEVTYMPPATQDVPGLVQEFIDWLNSVPAQIINPVLLAGIAHYEIARIHPFIDGNGRTARLLATLVLHRSGFDHRRLFALDDFYDQNRPAYYAALKKVQDSNNDLTTWLEYFTTGIALSVNEVKEAVLKLGVKRTELTLPQIPLTPKQMEIVEFITAHTRATNKDMRDKFKISAQAAYKELAKLVDLKVIKSVGHGRSLCYILA